MPQWCLFNCYCLLGPGLSSLVMKILAGDFYTLPVGFVLHSHHLCLIMKILLFGTWKIGMVCKADTETSHLCEVILGCDPGHDSAQQTKTGLD